MKKIILCGVFAGFALLSSSTSMAQDSYEEYEDCLTAEEFLFLSEEADIGSDSGENALAGKKCTRVEGHHGYFCQTGTCTKHCALIETVEDGDVTKTVCRCKKKRRESADPAQ